MPHTSFLSAMATNIMDKLRDKLSPSKNNRASFMKNLSGSQCLVNNSVRTFHSAPTEFQKNLFSSVDYHESSFTSNPKPVMMNNLDMFSKWIRAAPESHILPASESTPPEYSVSSPNILDNLRSSFQQCAKSLEPYFSIFKQSTQHNFQHPNQTTKETLAFNLVHTLTEMTHHLGNEKSAESASNMYYPSGISAIDLSAVSDMFQTMLIDSLVPPKLVETELKLDNHVKNIDEDVKCEEDKKTSQQKGVDNVLSNMINDTEMCEEISVQIVDVNNKSNHKVQVNADCTDQIKIGKSKLSKNIQPKAVNSQVQSKNKVNDKMFVRQSVTCSTPILKHSMSDSALLNKQMMDRKSKQISKRSKNRKRRQRKKNGSETTSQDQTDNVNLANLKQNKKVLNSTEDLSSPKLSVKPNKDSNCDIFCDFLNLATQDNSVKIGVSSFFIAVDSTDEDEDSDWDSCERDWSNTELSDFEFSGLFVANFTKSSVSVEISSSPPSAELLKLRCLLRSVNKNWKESMKDVDSSPKVPTKVSFAPEDDIEVCPVDVYDRKGEWEVYARERCRFQRRIAELDRIISPCLTAQHRAKAYERIQESN